MPLRLRCSVTWLRSLIAPGGSIRPHLAPLENMPASNRSRFVIGAVQVPIRTTVCTCEKPDAPCTLPSAPLAASGALVALPLAIQFEPAGRQFVAVVVIADPSHEN